MGWRKNKEKKREEELKNSTSGRITEKFRSARSFAEIHEMFGRLPKSIRKVSAFILVGLIVLTGYNLFIGVGELSSPLDVPKIHDRPSEKEFSDPWLDSVMYLYETGTLNDSTVRRLNESLGDTCNCPMPGVPLEPEKGETDVYIQE